MALTVKTRAEVIQDLVAAIKARDETVATGYGPAKDLVVDPVSQVVRELYLAVKHVYDIQFLKNAEVLMSTDELDLLGESLGIKRKGPIEAIGSVFFFTGNQPKDDILIPAGTPVSTKTGIGGSVKFQSYTTTRTTTIFASTAAAFFNPSSGVYEFEVPIRAVQPGSAGNTAAGTITSLMRPFTGIAGSVNKSGTSGGRDTETNAEYARRIRLALLGTDRGTVNGLRRFGLEDARVIDALVVQSGDPLLTRTEAVAGAVDVYILGEEPTVTQQVEIFTGLDIFFIDEPLVFPSPVSSVSTTSAAFVEGTHYFIDKDPLLDGSGRSRDILRWNRSRTDLPASGDSVTIEYNFDRLIQDLQKSIEAPEHSLLADIIFRRARQVDLALVAAVKVVRDADLSTVAGSIRTAITDFVNSRGLGASIHPSDIDLVIRSVPGVDFVFLPFTVLAELGETGSGTVVIEKNEFPQISDAGITLTLSN